MKIIKIMNEFHEGPLWYCGEDGILLLKPTGFEIFLDDDELNETADEISRMFNGYYEFNSHGQACWFNEEQEKRDAPRMLFLLKKLRARIDELNDGSFLVEDYSTSFYEELAKSQEAPS